jgi:hypothetical protein
MSQQEPNPNDASQGQSPKSQPSVTHSDRSESSIRNTIVRVLRSIIRLLEGTVETLETERAGLKFAQVQTLLEKLWQGFLPLWRKLLEFVRGRLSEEWNQKLGDRALSGVLAGGFVILFWFTSSVFSPKPAKTTTIATRPTIEAPPQPEKPSPPSPAFEVPPKPSEPFPTDLSAPEPLPSPEVVAPSTPVLEPVKDTTEDIEGPTEPVEETPDTSEVGSDTSESPTDIPEAKLDDTETRTDAITAAPDRPDTEVVPDTPEMKPDAIEPIPDTIATAPESIPETEVKSDTIEVTPAPIASPSPEPIEAVELTPEQKRIASVQKQVIEVSDQFIGGLVDAVVPNFEKGRLMVKVTDDWYRFKPEQQDRFANQVWQRSQSLDFTTLEITNTTGTLLARNPVIGSSMVILKRKQLN